MTRQVVLIHGAFSAPFVFDRWRDFLEARGVAALAPALRHHDGPPGAGAPPGLAGTGLRDYADDLAALIAGLPEPPVLVGHSMGGLLAQMLAARGRAAAIVLLAPSAPWGVMPATELELFGAMSLILVGPFWQAALSPDRSIALQTGLARLPPAERARFLDRLVPESGRAIFETLYWMWDRSRASQVDADAARCPILAVSGGRDEVNAPATVRAIARRYRQAAYRDYPDIGHWLIAEPGWDRIAADSLDWLAEAGVLSPPAAGAAAAS